MLNSFASMRIELLRRLGGRTDAASSARAGDFLDSAQAKLAEANFQIPYFEQVGSLVVVAGTPQYVLSGLTVEDAVGDASDLIGIRIVQRLPFDSDTNDVGWRMSRMSWREWREIERTQASGPPTRWARNGLLFAVDPKPDRTYTLQIDFRRRPGAGELVVTPEWQETMMQIAEAIGWRAFGQPDLAVAAMNLLPKNVQMILTTPLDYSEWDALWDDNLGFQPRMHG